MFGGSKGAVPDGSRSAARGGGDWRGGGDAVWRGGGGGERGDWRGGGGDDRRGGGCDDLAFMPAMMCARGMETMSMRMDSVADLMDGMDECLESANISMAVPA